MTIPDIPSAEPETAPAGAIRGMDVLKIAFLGLLIGIVLVVAMGIAGALVALSGDPSGNLEAVEAQLRGGFYPTMAIIVVVYAPILWLMWRVAKRMRASGAPRFFAPVSRRTILLALFAGALISLLYQGMEWVLSSQFGISFEVKPYERILFPSDAVQFAVAIAVVSLYGPFVEEFFFRGFLLGWLRQRMGVILSLLLSAAAFAVVHGFMVVHPGASGWISTGEIFAVGILLGGIALYTRSLWPCFGLHAIYNATVVVQMMQASA